MAVARRQCGENQTDVGAARDVVGNDQHGSTQTAEIVADDDARVAENLRGGRDEGVVNGKPQPANGLALRPERVNIVSSARAWLLQAWIDACYPLSISG